jgi:hypothetical protein
LATKIWENDGWKKGLREKMILKKKKNKKQNKTKRAEEERSTPQNQGENRTDLTVEDYSCMNLGKETVDCPSGYGCHMGMAG